MSVRSYSLNVPAAPGVGTASECQALTEKWVEVVNPGLATTALEVSFDTVTWFEIDRTAITELVQIAVPARYIRVNLIAVPANVPVCTLHGKPDTESCED